MKNNENNGICFLCSKTKKLTFEHTPPKSAFNDKPCLFQDSESLTNKVSKRFNKKMKSQKGAGSWVLCETCNNITGDWYARDYIDFARQGRDILMSYAKPERIVEGKFILKPLNVLNKIW